MPIHSETPSMANQNPDFWVEATQIQVATNTEYCRQVRNRKHRTTTVKVSSSYVNINR